MSCLHLSETSSDLTFAEIGNPRGNENPFLLTFGILWFRYHNFKARQLKANHDDWNDERLFNEARKWTIAIYQVSCRGHDASGWVVR